MVSEKIPGSTPKKLRLQQGLRIGVAVDGDKGLVGPPAQGVDILGGHVLSGSGFSDQENIGIGGSHPLAVQERSCIGGGFCLHIVCGIKGFIVHDLAFLYKIFNNCPIMIQLYMKCFSKSRNKFHV